MTARRRRGPPLGRTSAGLLHRRASEVRHDSALPDARVSHPQIFMPEVKEPRYFAPEPRAARIAAEDAAAGATTRYDDYAYSLFARARPEQLAGEASPQYLRVRARRGGDRRAAAGGANHRDPARAGELPALVAPAAGHTHIEDETDFAKAIALEDARGERASASRAVCPRPRRCSTPSTCATSSSCGGFHDAFPGEQHARRDLRGLPSRQRGRRARASCASSASTTTAAIETSRRSRSRAVRSMRLHSLRGRAILPAAHNGRPRPGASRTAER